MLNEALRLIRAYHDLSQTQLCVELGVSNSYLSEIESGKKTPSLDLLQKYSSYFEIPVSSLIFFSENLDNSKITDKLRVGTAKKIISILQWNEQRSNKFVLNSRK
jgi:transcriptional regulator with XRE-family HTH domain